MGDTSLSGLYILNGKTPVPVGSIEEWSKSFFPGRSTLAREYVGDTYVSTIFLGADYSFGGRPLFFETLVDKGDDFYTVKYSTWDGAMAGHAVIVADLTALL